MFHRTRIKNKATEDRVHLCGNNLIRIQHCTTHGIAPKGSGPYLRAKTQIHHTHTQHLSTSTHATTNDKNTHSNRMGRHSWLPIRQS